MLQKKKLCSKGRGGKVREMGQTRSKSSPSQPLPAAHGQQHPSDINRHVLRTLKDKNDSNNIQAETLEAGGQFTSTLDKRTYPVLAAQQRFQASFEKSKLLCNISSAVRDKLFDRAAVPVFVSKDDVLFEQGTSGHLLFILIHGAFEQITENAATGTRKCKPISAGSAIAERCVVDMHAKHEFTLRAKSKGFLLAIHRVQFQMISVYFNELEAEQQQLSPARRGILRSIPFFAAALDEAQMRALEALLVEQTFKYNERILAPKQPIPAFYIILHGQVGLRTSSNGNGNAQWEQTSSSSSSAPTLPTSRASMTTSSTTEKRDLDSKILFPDSDRNTIEWLTQGDYFGASMLFPEEEGGRAQMGVNVMCSSRHGVRLLALKREDWRLFATKEMERALRQAHLVRLMHLSPSFAALNEEELAKLAVGAECKTFADGEQIMEGGAPATHLFLLEQGAVKLFPFTGLRQTPSYFEFQNRAKNLIHATSLRHGGLAPSQAKLFAPTNEDNNNNHGGPRSFLEMSSQLFGEPNSMHSALLLGQQQQQAQSEETRGTQLAASTSLDHSAMLASLGVTDHSSVVLLPGEAFGELNNSGEAPNKTAVFAIGRVSVLAISRDILRTVLQRDSLGFSIHNNKEKEADAVAEEYLDCDAIRREELAMLRSTPSAVASSRFLSVLPTPLHETDLVWVNVCMHEPSGMFTVVKELNVARANERGVGQYVLREQVMLAQAGQSNFIARMAASWEEPERLYLALEYAVVGDLRFLLFRTQDGARNSPAKGELGGLDFATVRWVAACVVLALKHLAEHRVLHRDVKPNNVVMDHRGYCKLIDFGLSKLLLSTSGARTLTKVGSPKYMAPELVQLVRFYHSGNSYTNAVDWWALGMTLYELSVGKLPFNLPSHMDPFERINEYHASTCNVARHAWFDTHAWFAPFRQSGNWRLFGNFVAQLLDPNADLRLGSACTPRGARGAMAHPLFQGLDFAALATRTCASVPFMGGLSASATDFAKARADAKKLRSIKQSRHTHRNASLPSASASAASRPRPKLVREKPSLETVLRADLENPAFAASSAKMNQVFEAKDEEQKHMILAREQHIRKTAFKQGKHLADLSEDDGGGASSLVLLQRASVIEALQVFLKGVQGGANVRLRENYFATRIQANWRGARLRRHCAATRIQALVRGHLVRRQKSVT